MVAALLLKNLGPPERQALNWSFAVVLISEAELLTVQRKELTIMPKFIDSHPMKPFTARELSKLQKAPPDEFGVTHHDILFSEEDDKIYCVLDAPNVEAIHKHHAKAGIKCDWVHEVESTRE